MTADGGGQKPWPPTENSSIPTFNGKELSMLSYAAVFLVIGLIGHVLYLGGVTSVAVQMSWILVLIGAVLGTVHVVTDF
jgi:uncharacterized membrane protein YtjA (UPF0391 family)